jgi:hypothetical protein
MSDHDDHVQALLERATGSPTLTARDELLNNLVERIDAGGVDVEDAPVPRPRLTAISGGRKGGVHAARVSSIGLAGIVVLAVGTAAAASVGAWLAFGPKAPPTPVMITTEPTIDTAPIPPIDSPHIESAATDAAQAVVPPDLEPVEEVPVLDSLGELVPGGGTGDLGDIGDLGDVLAPVISAISVGELRGTLLEILQCTATAPISVTATDDAAVTSVVARVTALGGIDVVVPLVNSGGNTWTGSLGALSLLQSISLGAVATVTVEASDAAGNTAVSVVDVPLHTLVCG